MKFPWPNDATPREVLTITYHLHFGIKNPRQLAKITRYQSPSHTYEILKKYRNLIDYRQQYDFTP